MELLKTSLPNLTVRFILSPSRLPCEFYCLLNCRPIAVLGLKGLLPRLLAALAAVPPLPLSLVLLVGLAAPVASAADAAPAAAVLAAIAAPPFAAFGAVAAEAVALLKDGHVAICSLQNKCQFVYKMILLRSHGILI